MKRTIVKKTFGILLTLVIVATMAMQFITVRSFASVTGSGSCGNILWVLDEDGLLTISGEGNMNAECTWLNVKEYIKAVVIEEGITTINNLAFVSCNNLTKVIIPDSVTDIGHETFYECGKLCEISLPKGLTYIGEKTFMGCSSLESIDIPEGVISIQLRAFAGCSSLAELKIPSSVRYIQFAAFSGCSSLRSISIPDKITNIEWRTFAWCTSLAEVTIPWSVTGIASGAFEDCTSLADVYYACSEEDWNKIEIEGELNNALLSADIHFTGSRSMKNASCVLSGLNTATEGLLWTDYDGSIKRPEVTVTYNETKLIKGTDFTVSYSDNRNAGVASVKVEGTGKYTGNVTRDFLICFKDVPVTHNYRQAVYWAVGNKIAAGYSGDRAGIFGVSNKITRGQVVMFLWRAAGKPEPVSTKQKFSDVPSSHNFFKAVQWAAEKGIAGGYSGSRKGQFGPSDPCTRGQIVMFLWRYAGQPEPYTTEQLFTDVPGGSNFFIAVQWASGKGITAGYKDGTFGVNKTCTRGQCVTFLYRLIGQN